MTPPRVQIDWRRKGGRKPDGVVVCSRPSPWGNPWRVEEYGIGKRRWFRIRNEDGGIVKGSQSPNRERAIADCLRLYRWYLESMTQSDPAFLDPLRAATGLACYCDLADGCHVDAIREELNR